MLREKLIKRDSPEQFIQNHSDHRHAVDHVFYPREVGLGTFEGAIEVMCELNCSLGFDMYSTVQSWGSMLIGHAISTNGDFT